MNTRFIFPWNLFSFPENSSHKKLIKGKEVKLGRFRILRDPDRNVMIRDIVTESSRCLLKWSTRLHKSRYDIFVTFHCVFCLTYCGNWVRQRPRLIQLPVMVWISGVTITCVQYSETSSAFRSHFLKGKCFVYGVMFFISCWFVWKGASRLAQVVSSSRE